MDGILGRPPERDVLRRGAVRRPARYRLAAMPVTTRGPGGRYSAWKDAGLRHVRQLGPWLAVALLWLAGAPPALAHTGQPPAPADLWSAWNWSLGLWISFGL